MAVCPKALRNECWRSSQKSICHCTSCLANSRSKTQPPERDVKSQRMTQTTNQPTCQRRWPTLETERDRKLRYGQYQQRRPDGPVPCAGRWRAGYGVGSPAVLSGACPTERSCSAFICASASGSRASACSGFAFCPNTACAPAQHQSSTSTQCVSASRVEPRIFGLASIFLSNGLLACMVSLPRSGWPCSVHRAVWRRDRFTNFAAVVSSLCKLQRFGPGRCL